MSSRLSSKPRAKRYVRCVSVPYVARGHFAASSATVTPIALYVREAQGKIRGGLTGFLAWDWLSVDLLWVDAALRGQGYGSELLATAEQVARDSGCVAVRLDTYDFQARPFYERHGYVVWGVLEGYPAGRRTFHMRKSL